MEPIWGRQDPGGPHVGPMNFAIWVGIPPPGEIIHTNNQKPKNVDSRPTIIMYLCSIQRVPMQSYVTLVLINTSYISQMLSAGCQSELRHFTTMTTDDSLPEGR